MDFLFWLLSYLVPFVAILTVIVFVHEMGHYLVARWNGIAVDAFSIGFGPELFGWTDKTGTRWRVAAIPLGGYVKFTGDMNAASMTVEEPGQDLTEAERKNLFFYKNVWRRIAVVIAGPAANVIFTFLVLYALLLGYGRIELPAVVETVTPGAAAEMAGIAPGDIVKSVDGYHVRGFFDFQRLVSTAPGRPVDVTVDRAGEVMQFVMTPDIAEITDRFGNTHRIGRIGVSRTSEVDDYVHYRPSPIEAVGMTLEEMQFIVDRTVAFIADFFHGRGDLDQLGGPVKVAQVSGEVATLGIVALINLAALLSLNIGLVNLLPIPMLDGGHLLYYFAELVRGRPLSQRVQEFGFRIGVVLVFSLMMFTLVNDLL